MSEKVTLFGNLPHVFSFVWRLLRNISEVQRNIEADKGFGKVKAFFSFFIMVIRPGEPNACILSCADLSFLIQEPYNVRIESQ